ncbi:hypothetical protein [Clostridium perfringens str. 13]|uniref:Uncharacterized protein n=1 Tax=Clostridium perfringens (strain 13 / Type A) TaxID=195102 RepID=Q8XKY0_CLOPE|nr:hypothetical protein [Clostridium perfringens str. 13]
MCFFYTIFYFSLLYRSKKSPSIPSKPLVSLRKLWLKIRHKSVTTPSLKHKKLYFLL